MGDIFTKELNEEQLNAVRYLDGPMMIIAGAGSGKTRVLTYKILYLLEHGFKPDNIMALTFTNKAANELKSRINKFAGEKKAKNIAAGTFHSVFSRIIRKNAELIGHSSSYTVFDTESTRGLLKEIIKDMRVSERHKPDMVQTRISQAKMMLVDPYDYAQNQDMIIEDTKFGQPHIVDIYLEYWQRCRRMNVLDFDDLLLFTFKIFNNFPEILRNYQDQYTYILVDEYQDTNYAQYAIVKQLADLNEQLCVVGDDSQSIYSFRGANIGNIFQLREDFPNLKTFILTRNYRSTKRIVDVSNNLISYNKARIEKKIVTDNELGEPIAILTADNEHEEARKVVSNIFQLIQNYHYDYKDFVILYRVNALSRALEDELRRLNLPYRIYGGMSFYERKEIKDALAYFRFIVNPNDIEDFKRIINLPPRGIGNTTALKLQEAFYTNSDLPFSTLLAHIDEYELDISKPTQLRIKTFHASMEKYRQVMDQLDAFNMAKKIIYETGYYKYVESDSHERAENLDALLSGIQDYTEHFMEENDGMFPTLEDYLAVISLITSNDEIEEDNVISLMTIHNAKGLEFDNVFVVGVEENVLPHFNSLMETKAIEEERRTFYVAITRARKRLYISFSMTRFSKGVVRFNEPSRFIFEMDNQNFDAKSQKLFLNGQSQRKSLPGNFNQNSNYNKKYANDKPEKINSKDELDTKVQNYSLGINLLKKLKDGVLIEHNKFGKGKIISIEGNNSEAKALVEFETAGKKHIILKFAKIRILQ
jgi:DNA helicase-2/ATP-dependent DNA helicase PcrA